MYQCSKKERQTYPIRPHHGMCLAFFIGNGYSNGFTAHMQGAVTKLIKNEKFLNIISQGEMIRLPICQINYAEVNSNYITIHSQQTITLKMTLSELEKKLDSHFFRAGRSALVNLKKISRVTKKEIYLQDGSIIPLPRGAYEKVNRAIINMD